jgi:hypothetical protein
VSISPAALAKSLVSGGAEYEEVAADSQSFIGAVSGGFLADA